MIANELRLGNWVNYRSTMGTIFPIQVVIGTIEEAFERPNSGMIRPIPLTEEILIKCGWVWNEDMNAYEKYPNGDARLDLSKNHILPCYTMFNYVLKALISERIYHLHQLQNLYFALTGKELTYTP